MLAKIPANIPKTICDKVNSKAELTSSPIIILCIAVTLLFFLKSTKPNINNVTIKKGSAITSDDIKNESQSLYKDVLAKYNSLCNARKSIGLSHIKEAPNSWTLDKVLLESKPIINKLGRMPKKSELSLSLYYGVQKYGGLKKLAELISEKE